MLAESWVGAVGAIVSETVPVPVFVVEEGEGPLFELVKGSVLLELLVEIELVKPCEENDDSFSLHPVMKNRMKMKQYKENFLCKMKRTEFKLKIPSLKPLLLLYINYKCDES